MVRAIIEHYLLTVDHFYRSNFQNLILKCKQPLEQEWLQFLYFELKNFDTTNGKYF